MNRYIAIAGGFGLLLIIAGFMGHHEKPATVRKAPSPAAAPPLNSFAADLESYDLEIASERETGRINMAGAEDVKKLGALDVASGYLQKASTSYKTATCLTDQRNRQVPFYEGKARCNQAVS